MYPCQIVRLASVYGEKPLSDDKLCVYELGNREAMSINTVEIGREKMIPNSTKP